MVQPLPIIEQVFGSYALAVTKLIYFMIVFIIIYFIGNSIFLNILDKILNRHKLDEHAKVPIKKLSKFVIFFIAITAAFGFAGFGNFLTSLATIGAAATLVIGLAMQDVMKNFISGLFIYIEKPFRIGHWIEWEDKAGVVEDISLRVTRLRTFDNELLTVPNSVLTSGVIKNPVAKDKLRLKFVFGIAYEDDIQKATDIILEEAEKNKDILEDPEPVVRLDELADSYIGLKTMFWIKNPSKSDRLRVKSEYAKEVKERFEEAGIEIPFPQITLSGKIGLENQDEL